MASKNKITPPEPISDDHDLVSFCSGHEGLDRWLQTKARRNERRRGSRTFVICDNNVVIGYYALATGAILHREATSRVKRNMPDPVPAMVIGRLAIDEAYQRDGLGRELLQDAVSRTVAASEVAGIRVILVHAISADAKKFYESCGFTESPVNPMTMMITVDDAIASLG